MEAAKSRETVASSGSKYVCFSFRVISGLLQSVSRRSDGVPVEFFPQGFYVVSGLFLEGSLSRFGCYFFFAIFIGGSSFWNEE